MGGSAGGSPVAGSATGGAGGSATGSGGAGGSSGSGGGSGNTEGPCDIYEKGGNPCVAAYSTIRRLLSTYAGPLYQVRTGSNAMNTGSGGQTVDIGQTAAGFADIAAQDTACAGTICTVAKLYDHSGKGNDITVAKAGLSNGGQYAALDDFETIIGRADTDDKMKVGGQDVYSLFMEARQGYRQTAPGNEMALGDDPQGIYMLADGTRTGTACCWDFGNVSPNPKTYAEMNTLFFGVAFWGKGAGTGPWFGADIEAGVWMGGSNPGEPGWGALDNADEAPANTNNPALRVKYALGFLKTGNGPERYALRMADLQTATAVTTAYAGNYPAGRHLDSRGAVVLGVGGDNSNNAWSTFYEGAIVQGFPTDATEDAVMQNLKALGYGQ
jgi:non-reducing end alpha-L-arabinofuranosidase